ncbi:hypothetical protein THIX_60636 [Thiomonas sp. X19]|nr:hypothetical protein THIX_60636 [Thiomonas sp. X19]
MFRSPHVCSWFASRSCLDPAPGNQRLAKLVVGQVHRGSEVAYGPMPGPDQQRAGQPHCGGAHHVQRPVHAEVDACPGHRQAEQGQAKPGTAPVAMEQEREGRAPDDGEVVTGKTAVGRVGKEPVADTQHERPRLGPDQADELVEPQAQQRRQRRMHQRRTRRLPAPQPAGHQQQGRGEDQVLRREPRRGQQPGRGMRCSVEPEKHMSIERKHLHPDAGTLDSRQRLPQGPPDRRETQPMQGDLEVS